MASSSTSGSENTSKSDTHTLMNTERPLTFDTSSSEEFLPGEDDSDHNSAKAKKRVKTAGQKASKKDDSDEPEDEKVIKNRLSAKECRVRKKLRYQYLAELIVHSEEAVFKLQEELKQLEKQCKDIDKRNTHEATD